MPTREIRAKLEPDDLPPGFSYPASFEAFVATNPDAEAELEPWGLVADPEADRRYGPEYGHPLVKFAQAWLEDMIACFVVGADPEPRVVVLNPWADKLVDGEWKKVCQVVEEFPSFSAWLEWARSSDLVKGYADARTQNSSPKGS